MFFNYYLKVTTFQRLSLCNFFYYFLIIFLLLTQNLLFAMYLQFFYSGDIKMHLFQDYLNHIDKRFRESAIIGAIRLSRWSHNSDH